MSATKKYASVILPLPVESTFTYVIPEAMESTLRIGCRVLVQFGAKHFYTGIVEDISLNRPQGTFDLKEITQQLDSEPIVRPLQLRLWRWISAYYLCSIGDVFKAAMPGGLKIESETKVQLIENEEQPVGDFDLSSREIELLSLLQKNGALSVKEISKKLEISSPEILVSRLVDKGLVSVSEKVLERYRPVRQAFVRPTLDRNSESSVEKAYASVGKSAKQQEALTALLALSEYNRQSVPVVDVPLSVLIERTGLSREVFKALAKKGACEIFDKQVSRFSPKEIATSPLPQLSIAQSVALKQIHKAFIEKDVVLLHGVTASGKTEIYSHLIDFVLKEGKQSLFLVPEIALTTQLTRRLQAIFGDKVVIYHSKFSDNERVEIWRRILNSTEPLVVIGARSAVFLPFAKLGIVIVDEEHEASYKQYDPAPRYNGRDVATVLAAMHGAKTLFGSATPSVETYFKAKEGKFGLVELSERYTQVDLPKIEVVDMKAERGKKAVEGYFSHHLLSIAANSLNKGKQAIFFHNRRGYSPLARCKMCAFIPKCDFCDVSLTYHQRRNRLVCHYCGAEYPVPELCPKCKEPAMEIVGYGTERLEDEIKESFGGYKVLRMDLDTTRNKESYGKIIDDFSQHKADILVGTQMVTKGLDFGEVETVGILNADTLINFPDFRSAERAFNMIEQVAGRAGRRDGQGRVVIQTYTPDHPVLDFARRHDYRGFYEFELQQRKNFLFPPFSRIINIYIKHRDPRITVETANKFVAQLRESFGSRVSAPKEPSVARVNSLYIRQIMLKIEPNANLAGVKDILRRNFIQLVSSPLMKGVSVYYDVDPV